MMIVKKAGAAGAAPVSFDLGHGAVLTARALDAFESKMVAAEARAELNAIIAGDAPQRAWPTLEPRFAIIRVDTAAQAAALSWMHAVLLAAASAIELKGVREFTDAEAARAAELDADIVALTPPKGAPMAEADRQELQKLKAELAVLGTPLDASFEALELLFNDSGVETAFRFKAYKVEEIWSAEKNVSGPGPIGSGPVAMNTAKAAKPPAMPAPAADAETTAAAVPSQTQPQEPPKAPLPGTPPPAAEAGSSSD